MGLPQQPDWTSQSGHVCCPPRRAAVPPALPPPPRPAAGLGLRGAVGGAARALRGAGRRRPRRRGSRRGGGGLGGWGGRRPPSSRRGRLARLARPSGSARVKAGTAPGGRGGAHLPSPPCRACGARWAPRRSCRGCSRTRWRTRTRCQVSGAPTALGAGAAGGAGTGWARGPDLAGGAGGAREGAPGCGLPSRPAGAARPRARGWASAGARRAGRQGRVLSGPPWPRCGRRTAGGLRRAPEEGRGRGAVGVSPCALEGGGNRARLLVLRTPRSRPAPRPLALAGTGGVGGTRYRDPAYLGSWVGWVGPGAGGGRDGLGDRASARAGATSLRAHEGSRLRRAGSDSAPGSRPPSAATAAPQHFARAAGVVLARPSAGRRLQPAVARLVAFPAHPALAPGLTPRATAPAFPSLS